MRPHASFASQIIAAAPDKSARINFAYRRALARNADPEEVAMVGEFLDGQLARYHSRTGRGAKGDQLRREQTTGRTSIRPSWPRGRWSPTWC